MPINIAINGYGRIGRCLLRAIYEQNQKRNEFNIIAINDLSSAKINTQLTKYDTVHGKFKYKIKYSKNNIIINDHDNIKLFQEKDPEKLPWKELKIDIVMECTGLFTSKEKCKKHINAGANKVIISAPGDKEIDATIVYGVNHKKLTKRMQIISNASCTTNCLAPLAMIIDENFGIKSGLMTTIHSYTNDQSLVDGYHLDLRRARAASHNIIPTNTGAAKAVGLVLPKLQGILDGFAIRVPTLNVSLIDLTFNSKKNVDVKKINETIYENSKNKFKNIIGYNSEELVSSDFNHEKKPSIFDSTQTRINGNLCKILSWYDNEWGFANQMLKTASHWFSIK